MSMADRLQASNEFTFLPLPEALCKPCASFTKAVTAMPCLRVLDLSGGSDTAAMQLLQLLATGLAGRRRHAAPPLELVHAAVAAPENADWLAELTLDLELTNIRVVACAGTRRHGHRA